MKKEVRPNVDMFKKNQVYGAEKNKKLSSTSSPSLALSSAKMECEA